MSTVTRVRPALRSASADRRPSKRARFAEPSADSDLPSCPPQTEPHAASKPAPRIDPASLHRPHPLGLKPSGNALLAPARAAACRSGGLGGLARLPDALLLDALAHLPAPALFRLQAASRALLAFARHPPLWKALVVRACEDCAAAPGVLTRWDGDWRRTCFALCLAPEEVVRACYADAGDEGMAAPLPLPADDVRAPDLCSDVLYQPHLCAAPLAHHFLARGAAHTLARADARGMSAAAFADAYAAPGVPVVLAGLMDAWPCMADPDASWSLDALARRFPAQPFRAEALRLPLPVYARYAAAAGAEDSPLYLFDAEFVRRSGGAMGDEFEVPELFGEDLFRVMGPERPDYRWLIAGPERSGSSWHKDPNATSAWNAVITGAKGWLLLPPHLTPPGVFVSPDEAEVTAPLSLAEWFEAYYAHTRAQYGPAARDPRARGALRQGVCRASEVMYIPAGWWHLVVNLEPGVALTQNFVSETELPAVLRFLRDRPAQVSGFKLRGGSAGSAQEDDERAVNAQVYPRFVAALERDAPGILARAQARMARDEDAAGQKGGGRERGLWDAITRAGGEARELERREGKGFAFGFGEDAEGEDEMGEVPW